MNKIFLFIFLLFSYLFSQDRGQKLFEEKKYIEAQKYYESILNQRENDEAALYGLGSSIYYQNNIEGALNSFENILSSEDKDLRSKVFFNIARILQDKNETEKSLAYYRKSLELNPNDIDTKINYELLKNKIEQNKEKNDGGNKENNENKNEEKQQNDGQDKTDQNKNDNQSSSQENEDNKNKKEENNSSSQDKSQKQEKSHSVEQNESQQNENKSDELMQAEAILNALKDQEKINQKQKILKTKSFKFDKDW
tara:strand:+ start:377 stop:1135 length:759 start_codon:yes stop_codon:yes gene_type:complete